ncbi:hypothetical protein YN1551_3115 [Sulfolobus islandicus Y.N.15.51]|uniref:Uncharacterized protein n=1 Tax=Saccharolobus islandicus (strain Y.N.15.51 / Yellowstone \|nr:hypothetical protein YN1551_3115 [Sulfolobus islandicus Y.N.15.51]
MLINFLPTHPNDLLLILVKKVLNIFDVRIYIEVKLNNLL